MNLDEGPDGIRVATLKYVSLEIRDPWIDDELRVILGEAVRDNDGLLCFAEFVHVMKKAIMFEISQSSASCFLF
jgi:Ca2+-binding EF-hand superfamily protein